MKPSQIVLCALATIPAVAAQGIDQGVITSLVLLMIACGIFCGFCCYIKNESEREGPRPVNRGGQGGFPGAAPSRGGSSGFPGSAPSAPSVSSSEKADLQGYNY